MAMIQYPPAIITLLPTTTLTTTTTTFVKDNDDNNYYYYNGNFQQIVQFMSHRIQQMNDKQHVTATNHLELLPIAIKRQKIVMRTAPTMKNDNNIDNNANNKHQQQPADLHSNYDYYIHIALESFSKIGTIYLSEIKLFAPTLADLFQVLCAIPNLEGIEICEPDAMTQPMIQCMIQLFQSLSLSVIQNLKICITSKSLATMLATILTSSIQLNFLQLQLRTGRNTRLEISDFLRDILSPAFQTNQSICSLDLTDHFITEPHLSIIIQSFIGHGSLKELNMSGKMTRFGIDTLITLQQLLSHSKCKVTTLKLFGNYLSHSESHFYCFAKALQNNSTIKILDLRDTTKYSQLLLNSSVLQASSVVQELRLANNHLDKACVDGLAQLLSSPFTNLKSLNMGGVYVPTSCWQTLFQSMSMNNTLKSLCLNKVKNGLDISDIQALSHALTFNCTLVELDLSSCNLTDKSIQILAQAFPSMTSLKTLNVAFNPFGDDGASSILAAMKYNYSLVCINVEKEVLRLYNDNDDDDDNTHQPSCNSYETQINNLCKFNPYRRLLLLINDNNNAIATSVWPIVLYKANHNNDILYFLLRGGVHYHLL